MRTHKQTHYPTGLISSQTARPARIRHHRETEHEQVGSRDLWGKLFQRNGFMEMRVKREHRPSSDMGSMKHWHMPPPPLKHTPSATLQHETVLSERGSPFTLITAVTWHAVGCPSVLNIYVSTTVLPWWLSRLWHMLSLSLSLALSLSLSVFIKIQQNRTARKHKNTKA